MRVLLDTHALVWWFEDREKLTRSAARLLENPTNVVLISAASAWELAIKAKLGKFKSRELVSELASQVLREGFVELAISLDHALAAGSWDQGHKDPFDRMLAAQARLEHLSIVSRDEVFDQFPVPRIW